MSGLPARVVVTASPWLLEREIPVDADSADWPLDPPAGWDQETSAWRPELTRRCRDDPGYATVDLELADASDELICRAAWNLLTTICRPVPQYATGALFFPVEVAKNPQQHSPYSMTLSAATFHTDGTFLPTAPEIAAFLCLSAADEGGETVIVDGVGLFADLEQGDPSSAAVLLEEHPVDLRGQGDGDHVRVQPIANRDDSGRVRLRYLREYIEQGYKREGNQMADRTRAALDRFDALAADENRHIPVLLERGELLVIDNQRFLHGRRAFREETRRRRLRRVYGTLRGVGHPL